MFVVSSVRAKGSSLALVGYTSSDGDALWGKCFTSTSVAPHLFLLGWCLSFFWLWQTWPVTWGYWNTCFLVALCLLIVRRPNLEVAIKRLLHQVYKNTRVVLVPCLCLEVSPYSYFWGTRVSFATTDKFSVRVTKTTSRIGVSWTLSLPFYFFLNLNLLSYGHIIKSM